jgi:hypothetical protein
MMVLRNKGRATLTILGRPLTHGDNDVTAEYVGELTALAAEERGRLVKFHLAHTLVLTSAPDAEPAEPIPDAVVAEPEPVEPEPTEEPEPDSEDEGPSEAVMELLTSRAVDAAKTVRDLEDVETLVGLWVTEERTTVLEAIEKRAVVLGMNLPAPGEAD